MDRGDVPIPVSYTPIECNNPVITSLVKHNIVIDVDLLDGGEDIVVVTIKHDDKYVETLVNALKRFINEVRELVGEDIAFKVKALSSEYIYGLGLYTILTNEILRAIGLEDDELFEAGATIDKIVFKEDPLLHRILRALRRTYIVGSSIAYRDDEPYVRLENICVRVVGIWHLNTAPMLKEIIKEPAVKTAIIHLGGYTSIALARCILNKGASGCRDYFVEALRVLNALTAMIYSTPFSEGRAYIHDMPGYMSIIEVC